MKVFAIVFGIVAVAAAAAGVVWFNSGPSPSDFAYLNEPRIAPKADERMLVVEAKGDPNVVGAKAFKALFSAFFNIPGTAKRARPPAPRARWPISISTPRDEWVGHYALPVSERARPANGESDGLRTSVEMWHYGQVAEVLHVGPYSSELPDIQRLQSYVATQGYHVVGEHEEEYVKGPGMFFRGNPDHYLTIIRLRVEPGAAR